MIITVSSPSCNKADYYVDGKIIASAVERESSNLQKITIYEHGIPRYTLAERSRFEWILRQYLFLLSFFIRILLKPTYDIYIGNEWVGSSMEKWIKPIETFQIGNDIYKTYTHKNETFSLHKNNSQIALITKTAAPLFTTTSKPRSYSVIYDNSEPLWIIYMFCILTDYWFFLGGENAGNKKIIVFKDPYEKYTQWEPGK